MTAMDTASYSQTIRNSKSRMHSPHRQCYSLQ